jgi:hypothetical protein
MKAKAPAVAEWLLTRIGVPRNESLMGDLVEEYHSGRSALWFWRQTAIAVAITVVRDIQNHKLLAVRAMATGWLLTLAWWQLLILAQPRPGVWGKHTLWGISSRLTILLCPALIGWVVARTHRAQQASMVLVYAASIGIWSIWHFIVNYERIAHSPAANQMDFEIKVICFVLAGTLVGGFLQRPRRHLQDSIAP